MLLSDPHRKIKLFRIYADTTREDNFDAISPALIQAREMDIRTLVAITKEATTKMILKYARILGVLASPNQWIVVDLVKHRVQYKSLFILVSSS